MMNHSIIEVVFKVHAEVLIGQELRISGNVPALGCDDPDLSIPMITSPTNFPWWTTKDALYLPGDTGAVQYRYCVFSGGKFSHWESRGDVFRVLTSNRSDRLLKIIEDKFGAGPNEYDEDQSKAPKLSPTSRNMSKVSSSETRSFRARQFSEWSRRSMIDNNLNSQDGVVIVSYFLPVILSRTKTGGWIANWDKENILSLQMDLQLIWIGSIRYANAPIPVEDQEAVSRLLGEMNCFPVFIDQNTHYQFYDIFCKQNLWLAMHHVADVYGPLNQSDIGAKAQQNLWFVYSEVHNLFRNKVLEVYHPSYLIWIHGFHLMLLPTFLRRRLSAAAKIGFYFHTPFPSSEIWRTMSRREDLIRGILGADQIGFHLYEYARHFLTTCRRFLGYSYEMNPSGQMTVSVDGREVVITCIHVGIDLPRVDEILRSDSFSQEVHAWKSRFANKVIIAGIDRLERLKGIPLKLMAIEEFMEENPMWIGKIVFTMVGISAGERGLDYKLTQRDVKILVDKLNARFGGPGQDLLVYFEERNEREIRLSQRLAFFAASDVLMITATRDGLNRYPMEYTLARRRFGEITDPASYVRQTGAGLASQGLLIVSEFISSARVMRGALMVNPWRLVEVKDALKLSFQMSESERSDRMRRNLEFSTRLTTSNWAIHVLHDLKAVEKNHDPSASFSVGFGMQYKVMNLKTGFHALDVNDVCRAYRNSSTRLILLDWGGTLVSDYEKSNAFQAYAIAKGHAAREGPSKELHALLELLCSDVKNTIFVLSGKELKPVLESFGSVKGLGLGAEHGFYYRWPRDREDADTEMTASIDNLVVGTGKKVSVDANASSNPSKSKWQTLMELGDQSWKASAKLIMDIFVQRTDGSYIEKKGNALIWQFRDADPEFGFLQSKELEEHLTEIMAPYSVEVIRGGGISDGYIEVRPKGLSKGLFLAHAMITLKSLNREVDFIMAVGDDITDEPMFEQISRLHEANPKIASFSVTVGKKPSAANAYVDDTAAVIELLGMMSKCTEREKKYYSSIDLPSREAVKQASINQNSDWTGDNVHKLSPTMRAISANEAFFKQNEKIDESQGKRTSPETMQIKKSDSNCRISMTDYLNSLSRSNDEDGDGIFF